MKKRTKDILIYILLVGVPIELLLLSALWFIPQNHRVGLLIIAGILFIGIIIQAFEETK